MQPLSLVKDIRIKTSKKGGNSIYGPSVFSKMSVNSDGNLNASGLIKTKLEGPYILKRDGAALNLELPFDITNGNICVANCPNDKYKSGNSCINNCNSNDLILWNRKPYYWQKQQFRPCCGSAVKPEYRQAKTRFRPYSTNAILWRKNHASSARSHHRMKKR